MKCIIVDDSALSRKVVRTALESLPGVEIVALARDGIEAIERCLELNPDFVTMDLEMPRMNGIEAVRQLREKCPATAAVMVSGLTSAGANITTEALRAGAFDFVTKPSGSDFDDSVSQLARQLSDKLVAVKLRRVARRQQAAGTSATQRPVCKVAPTIAKAATNDVPSPRTASSTHANGIKAVCIGVSTGGPDALQQIIPKLPAGFPVPVLIVQHMPPVFTKSLADQLNRLSQVSVHEGSEGMRVDPGNVYIAPGGRQMKVESNGIFELLRVNEDPPVNNARPSVNYLFQSAVSLYGSQMLAVILTGMGNDGLKGCSEVSRVGGSVISQDAESCVVFGMPRCVQEAGLSNHTLPLDQIASKLCSLVGLGAMSCR